MILFLAANPGDTGRLALDQEARSIHVELKRSGFRDRFDFVTRWAAEPLDLLRDLRELRPTVVHFSGHGARPATEPAHTIESARTGEQRQRAEPVPRRDVVALGPRPLGGSGGLVVNGANGNSQVITPEAIAQTLDAVGARVRLVVLNACYTASFAEALLVHVDSVVGMSGSIHDEAARSFAIGFYGGLGERESIAMTNLSTRSRGSGHLVMRRNGTSYTHGWSRTRPTRIYWSGSRSGMTIQSRI